MTEKQKKIARMLLKIYLETSWPLIDEFNSEIPTRDFQALKDEVNEFANILEIEEPEFDWSGLL